MERVAQDRIALERFEDYWDADNVFVDGVTFLPIPDTSVRLANLQAGDLDMIERAAPTDLGLIRDDPGLVLPSAASLGYQGITINLSNPEPRDTPMASDMRVREAFELVLIATSLTMWCLMVNLSSAISRCHPRALGT